MKRYLTPITLAAAIGALAIGAAGGAVAASAASSPAKPTEAPAKRQELAKPILDQAVSDGQISTTARDRILTALGRANRPGRP